MKNNELPIRIGHGYDLHRLIAGRKLILGGVEIPFHLGLLGHSDADCLTHALADSILGALALPDIGHYFPDTDEKNKNIDSNYCLLVMFYSPLTSLRSSSSICSLFRCPYARMFSQKHYERWLMIETIQSSG